MRDTEKDAAKAPSSLATGIRKANQNLASPPHTQSMPVFVPATPEIGALPAIDLTGSSYVLVRNISFKGFDNPIAARNTTNVEFDNIHMEK